MVWGRGGEGYRGLYILAGQCVNGGLQELFGVCITMSIHVPSSLYSRWSYTSSDTVHVSSVKQEVGALLMDLVCFREQ